MERAVLRPGPAAHLAAVDQLALDRVERAAAVFDAAFATASDLGLLSEEADPESGRRLGNYPQGLSHVGLINAATSLEAALGVSRARATG